MNLFFFLQSAPLFPAQPTACRAAPAALGRPRATSCSSWRPRVAPEFPAALPLALVPSPLATPPRTARAEPPRRPPTGARRRPQFRLLLGRAHPRALFLAIPSTLGLTNRSAEPCFSIPPPLPSICAAARRPPLERPPRTSTSPVRPLNRTPLVP